MPSDLVWLLKERAVTHLRVFHWFSSKPGARCELLAEVITLNQKKTISGFGSTPCFPEFLPGESVSQPPVFSFQVLCLYPLLCRSSSTITTSCNLYLLVYILSTYTSPTFTVLHYSIHDFTTSISIVDRRWRANRHIFSMLSGLK